jgi:hypothetical protein
MTWVATGTAALTAAEIAAAEAAAAAAATAAAEAAASSAGTALVAEAAPAVTQLASTALPEVAGTVAPQTAAVAPGSILEAAPGVAPPPAEPLPPAGIEQVTPAGSTPPPPTQPLPPAGQEFSQAQLNAIQQGQADALAAQGTGTQVAGPAMNVTPTTPTPTPTPGAENAPTTTETPINNSRGITYKGQPTDSSQYVRNMSDVRASNYVPGQFADAGNPAYPSTMGQLQPGVTAPISPLTTTPPPVENSFMQGFSQFAKDNPFLTGAGIYTIASTTGMLNQKPNNFNQPEKNYTGPRLSADFKGGPYSEPNVYKPRYAAAGGIMQLNQGGMPGPVERMSANALGGNTNMFPQSQQERTNFATPTQMPASAEVTMENEYKGVTMAQGGIARYYRGRLATSDSSSGRDVYGATQRFLDMYDPQSKYAPPAEPGWVRDAHIFEDTNPSTRNKDALEAAQIRQKSLGGRANVNTGAKYVPASRGMGQLSFAAPGIKGDKEQDYDSVLAANGGIMQANLGSYAAGGNPRLLRGPGDGMSDNIPATIGGKQPARLADGEFVVPADVVSHLGNGSTDAGARKLHQMMDKVRMDRTGKKKQAPAVKPNKYIPK